MESVKWDQSKGIWLCCLHNLRLMYISYVFDFFLYFMREVTRHPRRGHSLHQYCQQKTVIQSFENINFDRKVGCMSFLAIKTDEFSSWQAKNEFPRSIAFELP